MRKFKGRSNQGCKPCRERHVKCDELKPVCSRCLKKDIVCESGKVNRPTRQSRDVAIAPGYIDTVPQRTHLEKNTFRQFVLRMAPVIGDFKERGFWIKTLLPAAHNHEGIFSAIIAYAALYGLPHEDAPYASIVSEQSSRYSYHKAIRWYSQSVRNSLLLVSNKPTVSNISLCLVQIVMFTNIEMRQGNVANAKILIKSAFAIVHSNSSHLWNCRDPAVLSILKVLIEIPLITMCDSTWIPSAHRLATITLGLKLSADMTPAAAKSYLLQFELENIMYDINDISAGRSLPEAAIDERLLRWHLSYLKFKSTPEFQEFIGFHDNTMFRMYHWSKLLWYALQHQQGEKNEELDGRAKELFSAFFHLPGDESEPDVQLWTSKPKSKNSMIECPMPVLEGGIVPACLTLAWYCRNQSVMPFVRLALDAFLHLERTKDVTHSVMSHIQDLITKKPYEITDVEIEIFGGRPSTLRWCQVAAYSSHFFRGGYGERSPEIYADPMD